MCIEDLQLGKRRFAGAPISGTGATARVLPPNNRRVAVILSALVYSYFDTGSFTLIFDIVSWVPGDNIGGNRAIEMGPGCSPIVLRVEDCGDLVTGSWSVNVANGSSAERWTIQEILTDVEVDAYSGGRR